MNNEEFLNIYIQNLSNKLGEQLKNEVLLATQFEIASKRISELDKENQALRLELEKVLNRKTPKKEVNTSQTF